MDSRWIKHSDSPVLGGMLGTCFDVCLLKEDDIFRMWFSWRPQKNIALTEGKNGIDWSEPVISLADADTGWENIVNRPIVIKRQDGYHMWYTGQTNRQSCIGHATSPDGVIFTRTGPKPVIYPDIAWEKVAVMCPHVIWDDKKSLYRMWYSGGDQYEPDAIGYATSPDGDNWTKHPSNPVFRPDKNNEWECHKVTACQVLFHDNWHYMFYIGFRDRDHAQIGIARSRDGMSNWQRHPANPIISPGANPSDWDHDAVYKPFVIIEENRWLMWYNGRNGSIEQIGLAVHEGNNLGF